MIVDGTNPNADAGAQPDFPGSQVLQLLELLQHWRIDAGELLKDTGLSASGLEEPNARIPLPLYNHLISRARRLTGEPALGIFMGLQRRVSMYGFLGFAAMSAATLGEVLELAVRFSPTVSTAIKLSLHNEGELTALRVEECCDPGECRDVAVFALIIGMGQMGRALTGRDVAGEAHLAIPRPDYADRFSELLIRMRFDQPVTQLVFESKALQLPLVTPDRAGLRLAREQCERALRDLGLDGGIIERVRSLMATPRGMLSLEEVAARLRMSARTLKRRLAAQGSSFSELLEEERCQRARLLLGSSQLSLLEITERLGYSTLPNFARAFRRWTGETPAAYRRAARKSTDRPSGNQSNHNAQRAAS
ncbi:MAG TPA: AraC family transcriptional regulator [Polyangiales bacterium]|jgi:AraC-like DNA-binding protein|nr:AraC family transcriptional regulator [Polyangiales bacterium]